MRWLVFAAWLGAVGVAHADVAVVGLNDQTITVAAPGLWCRTFVVYTKDGAALPALSIRVTNFQTDSGTHVALLHPVEPTALAGPDDSRDDDPCKPKAPPAEAPTVKPPPAKAPTVKPPPAEALRADANKEGTPKDAAHAKRFTLSVDLPKPGLYIATVVIEAEGAAPQVHQLSLQVGPQATAGAAVPVVVVGPASIEAVGDEATLDLGVHNTSSVAHTVTVAAPIVSRKHGARDQPAHELPADVGVRWSLTTPEGAAVGNELRLAGGGNGKIVVAIQGASPGEYAVTLSLSEPGMAPATLSGAVFVKHGWASAIALIAIGVGVAFGISRLRDVWLDSQAQRINLGRVMERLQLEPNGDAARGALRELKQQGQDLDRAITDRKDCRDQIESLGRRAVVFARANGSAAEISDLDDDRRGELRRKLDEVFRLVALPTGDTAAAAKLSEIEDKDAERKALRAALDAFAASIDDHRIEADAAFTVQLGDLSGRIQHLRELYQRDELDAAEHELTAVRDLLGKHGRDAIQRACDRAPAWTSAASWAQAMAGVKALLAAPDTSYDAVHGAFVDATVSLTVKDTKHPEVSQLVAAKDMSSRLQLMAKIHAETGPQERSLSLVAGLFAASPVREPAPPKPSAERQSLEPFEWRALARRSMRVEVLVLGVVMAVAVVAGVKALWVDNPTWGSWGDLLGAFLWGSGVQVGAEAFVGLAALRAALGRRA